MDTQMSTTCNARAIDTDLTDFLAALVKHTQDAIICTDAEDHIILFNPAAEQLFGWKADDILEENVHTVLPRFNCNCSRVVTTGTTHDGNSIAVDVAFTPMDIAGKTYKVSVVREADLPTSEMELYRKETKRRLLKEVGELVNLGNVRHTL